MKKIQFLILLTLFLQQTVFSQCNQGLNLGAVIVPTHGNASNSGNFGNVPAWQQAANWLDTFNLDYRQRYITWNDVVQQITNGVPTYKSYFNFENLMTTWSGNCNVHVVYPVIKVELPNTSLAEPNGFVSAVDSTNPLYFSDTSFVNQNYLAIKHILQNVNNVKWISIGNEIDTYFKNAFWNTGRLTRYTSFLDTVRNRMNADGFSYVKLGSVVAFHNLTWNGNYDIIDSIRPHLDFIGYTFYYTTQGPPNDNCWGNPASVISWLNNAKAEAGSKQMMLTETCMGDGGGILQNCGSPVKQLAYADTLLNWYNSDTTNIAGMTWFTVTDPFLGWQTPSTLWNTSGLVDSNGVTIQPAGTLWRHDCTTTTIESLENNTENGCTIFPNPNNGFFSLRMKQQLPGGKIILFNSLGQTISEQELSGMEFNFMLFKLPAGIYTYIISGDKISPFTGKIAVQDN